MNPPYRRLEHTSDVKVEIYGSDLAELFTNAAICLFDLILDRDKVKETVRQPVYLEDSSLSELFLDWLRELLFLFSTRSLAVRRAEIRSIVPSSMPSAVDSSSTSGVQSVESADALSGSGAPSESSACVCHSESDEESRLGRDPSSASGRHSVSSAVTSGYCIEAEVLGEEFDAERHGLKVEVKTPTYHEYRIDKTEDGYRATVILDV